MFKNALIFFLAFGLSAYLHAQAPRTNIPPPPSWAGWSTPPHSIDTDIKALKDNISLGRVYRIDDYLQVIPGCMPIILKFSTYESRSDWGRMLTSQSLSGAMCAVASMGLKWAGGRLRPDLDNCQSFPSGHTLVAFMGATMLHKEYGWRSPWWSFGGYTLATSVALSRVINNKHWVTDTWAGAIMGIGLTELGYYFGDLIFKDKGLNPHWGKKPWDYCSCDNAIYSVGPLYSRRFIMGHKAARQRSEVPFRGSDIGINLEIPLVAGAGLAFRATAGSLIYRDENSVNHYDGQVGMFWEREFNHHVEFEAEGLIGYAGYHSIHGMETEGLGPGSLRGGIDVTAGASLNIITGTNSKLKTLVEWNTMSYANAKNAPKSVPLFLNSLMLGTSVVFFW